MPRLTPTSFIATARRRFESAAEGHRFKQRLGREVAWLIDQGAGRLVLYRPDGIVSSALVQVIGSLSLQSGHFRWSWSDRAVRPELTQHAVLAREWGHSNGQASFTEPQVPSSVDAAWSFTAVAWALGNAYGGYRVCVPPAGPLLYLTFLSLVSWDPRVTSPPLREGFVVRTDDSPIPDLLCGAPGSSGPA